MTEFQLFLARLGRSSCGGSANARARNFLLINGKRFWNSRAEFSWEIVAVDTRDTVTVVFNSKHLWPLAERPRSNSA